MLSDEDVRKIAKLARLAVDDQELIQLTTDINSILEYVQQLEKIDVSQVEAMSHVHGSTNVFRDDVVQASMKREEALKNAPDTDGESFRVPLIIEQKTEN